MRNLARAVFVVAMMTSLGSGCGSSGPSIERTEGYGVKVDESRIAAELEGARLKVVFELARLGGDGGEAIDGELTVRLRQLDGDVGQGTSKAFRIEGDRQRVEVELPTPTVDAPGDLGGWVFDYRVKLPGGELYGRRSIFDSLNRTRMVVSGDNRFVVERPSVFRVRVVSDDGQPVAGERVRLSFRADAEDAAERELDSGATDARGELLARFTFKADELGAGTIKIVSGLHTSSHSVVVGRPRRVLLTTDKPLYQPGQTVHVRALAMRQPAMAPAADEPALIEIEGPQGNKLHKVEKKSDAHGIVAERFKLARLVNLGTYTITVSIGEERHSKTFRVERYTLPKFSVAVTTDQRFVAPGAKVTGEVNARYFFGQPVKAGQVRLSGAVAGNKVTEVIGKTDDQGSYRFELPDTGFGEGALEIEAEVTDPGGAVQRGKASLKLTHARHRVQLVTEPADAGQGDEVTVYLLVTDPVGKPLSGEVALGGAIIATAQVPASGLAQVATKIVSCGLVSVAFGGEPTVQTEQPLPCRASGGPRLRLSTDKALYAEGERVKISVVGPETVGEVSVELLSRNVPVASETVALKSGKGELEVPLRGAELRRTLQVRAFAGQGQQTLSASRLIYVAGNDQLVVEVDSDKESYRPGAAAKVTLRVTDRDGKPTAAALGVQVVDEALFALSEVKPGIERRYFWLEQEVVDAGAALSFVDATSLLVTEPTAADQLRARMLFAAASNRPSFPIEQVVGAEEEARARQASRAGFDAVLADFQRALDDHFAYSMIWPWSEGPSEAAIRTFAEGWLAGRQDAFGQPYRVDPTYRGGTLRCAGMDERHETDDDLTGSATVTVPRDDDWNAGIPSADGGAMGGWDAAAAMPDAGVPPPSAAPEQKPVREHFPETLYVNPALITDGNGEAEIDVALADSITSWRLTAIASSAAGQLGSTAAGIKVFQPFFIDVILPEHLLQNDEVTVPVAVYNYLADAQQVTIKVDAAPWFELLDGAEKQIELPARAVGSVKFRVRVKQVGTFALTARGTSAADSDAVKRQVRVLPDGVRKEVVFSGALEPGTTSHQVSIPTAAIEGSADLFVKVYPGILAEVIEGFEALLRAPSGCFEQTSSATYPNVMVLSYLRQAKLNSEELEQKASDFIAQGYQRLLSYEVSGGGFSLWGDPPAHPTLTAFGLMEFYDMSQVRFVDPQLLDRTRGWLLQRQEPSGAFAAPSQTAHSIAGGAHDDQVRGTAYTTWALAHSGETGPAVQKALSYLRGKAPTLSDAYSQAVVANALLAAAPGDATALELVAKLKASATIEGATAMWGSESQSLHYGYGDSMKIETTSMVLLALLAAGEKGPLVQQGMTYLTKNKDALGGYDTTQATVLALRVLLTALAKQGGNAAVGTVSVSHNGATQGAVELTEQTSDVTRYFDLKGVAVEGANDVSLGLVGSGELSYQVVGVYYLPHASQPASSAPFDFSVAYDRTELQVGQTLVATATIQKTGGGAVPQAMIHLGLPPGFTFDEARVLQDNKGVVNNVEQKGPHLVLYLGDVVGAATVTVPLTATLAVKAKAPASRAYPYYTPEMVRVAETPMVTVLGTVL